ncbi:DUF6766 family protein [Streptomyces sp. NBC_01268]|uniref:DUF6766 family protein n=1 Tax=Streptomyces sp. NBC_01268 TaxID=2903806 RepID=UPI002E36D61A|nr:DUF6766 family protein [Streptomyces sp. NBC_01268]
MALTALLLSGCGADASRVEGRGGGSPESKELHKAGPESDGEQEIGAHAHADSPRWAGTKGRRQHLYSRSPGTAMALLFLLSWLAQSIVGTAACNERQLRDLLPPVSWAASARRGGGSRSAPAQRRLPHSAS